MITIYGDFQNTDSHGNIRLNTAGSIESIERSNLVLNDGEEIIVESEDLSIPGVLAFSEEENIWVALVKWENLTHKGDD